MHTASLRKRGMVQEKLDALAGWRVSERFSDRERVALEWTEAVTLLSAQNTDDAIWQRVKVHFSDAEMSDLTIAAGLMNAFNRIAVSLRQ